MQQYRRVTYEVRCQIFSFLKTKIAIKDIATLTGHHKSTIYREIRRNQGKQGYRPGPADVQAKLRYLRCRRFKVLENEEIKLEVLKYLNEDWSPEQIAGYIKRRRKIKISKQTIYNEIRNHLPEFKIKLRRGLKVGRKKRTHRRKSRPIWMRSVHERPLKINNRKELGHWERDGMFTKDRKQVVVFLERKSRYVRIAKVKEPYCLHLTAQMKEMMKELNTKVLSLTNDNGNEFLDGEHYEIPVYYCDPRSPHQKGSVENAIGLLRQYIKRTTNLDDVTDQELQKIQDQLNYRPRKCLDYKTPHEVLYGKPVALAS